jgi:hypothetical protein
MDVTKKGMLFHLHKKEKEKRKEKRNMGSKTNAPTIQRN